MPAKRLRTLGHRDPCLSLPSGRIPLRGNCLPQSDETFEVAFYEDVLRKDPCEESCLIALGYLYTRRREYEKGLEIDRRLVRLRPHDPTALYNLACSLSLLGGTDEAFEALQQAADKGYRDWRHMLEDEDLARLRSDERFGTLCRRLRALAPDPAGGEG